MNFQNNLRGIGSEFQSCECLVKVGHTLTPCHLVKVSLLVQVSTYPVIIIIQLIQFCLQGPNPLKIGVNIAMKELSILHGSALLCPWKFCHWFFLLGNIWKNLEILLVATTWGPVLLASTGYMAGMLLHILQYIFYNVHPKISVLSRLRNSALHKKNYLTRERPL
jgi:hypothetical protein